LCTWRVGRSVRRRLIRTGTSFSGWFGGSGSPWVAVFSSVDNPGDEPFDVFAFDVGGILGGVAVVVAGHVHCCEELRQFGTGEEIGELGDGEFVVVAGGVGSVGGAEAAVPLFDIGAAAPALLTLVDPV